MSGKNNGREPVNRLCDIFKVDRSNLTLAHEDSSTENLLADAMEKFMVNYDSETQGGYPVGGYKYHPTHYTMVEEFIEYLRRIGNPSKDNIEVYGDVLLRLAIMCERTSPTDCVSINQIAIELGKKLGHNETVSGGLCNIGSCLSNNGNYKGALPYFRNALQVCMETGEDYYLADILECFRVTRTKMFFKDVSIKCGQCEKKLESVNSIPERKCKNCGTVILKKCPECHGKGRLEASRFLDECQSCSGMGAIVLPEHTLIGG
jgi:hypothetical protein